MRSILVIIAMSFGNHSGCQILRETHSVKRDHDTVTAEINLIVQNHTDSNLYYLNATYGKRLNDTISYCRVNSTGMFGSDIIYYAPVGHSAEIDSIFTVVPKKELVLTYRYQFVHKKKNINRQLRVIDFIFSNRSLFKETGPYEKAFNIYDTDVKKILCILHLKTVEKSFVTTKLIAFTSERHYSE